MYSFQLFVTEDGSHSVAVHELNESYHSVHGAITESRHVFIKNGFRYLVSKNNPHTVHILEIGLGSGLNVLLTLIENNKFNKKIIYTAIEPFPCPESILGKLNFPSIIGTMESENLFKKIHECHWNELCDITDSFSLNKQRKKYQDYKAAPTYFDLVYYDAFAPNKQPEMWDSDMLRKTAGSLSHGGMIVTYAAKGQLKRDLKSLGLEVETLTGPPGKKEMIRAVKN